MFIIHPKTCVTLSSGQKLPIGDVRLGDKLRGMSGDNKVLGITHTSVFPKVVNVAGVLATINQPFMTLTGWGSASPRHTKESHPNLPVSPLTADTDLVKDGNELETVEEIPGFEGFGDHYVAVGLELDGDHTYYVNDLLVHNGSGGGSSGGGTTIQKTEPPSYLKPYLVDIAKNAQAAYGKVPQGGFTGDLVASPTESQLTALDQQKQIASSLSGSNFGANTTAIANKQAQNVLNGTYTAPASTTFTQTNLATQPLVDSYLRPVQQNLQENIIPAVQSNAIQQGAYGGSRYFTDLGKQINDNYTTKAADIATQLGYSEGVRQDDQRFADYSQNKQLLPELLKLEQAAAVTAPELANSGLSQALQPSSILASAGQAEQLFNQDLLDQAYQKYLLGISGPFTGLDQYASLINGGNYGGTSTSQSSSVNGGSNFLSGALGGGLSGYGLASSIGMLNPYTMPFTIGGAVLGGLFS